MYTFKKGRLSDELAEAAKARTARDCPFGGIVAPFGPEGWQTTYYGKAMLSSEHTKTYSPWLVGPQGEAPSNNPVSHMLHPNPNRYRAPRSKNDPSGKSSGEQDRIFFQKEYEKVERNPPKRDQQAERLGMIEASHELFGDHRVLEASQAVDSPGNKRQAAEILLVNLPFKLLKPLMDYYPENPYWEPPSQIKALKYWMRTPFYSDDPYQAREQRWYMKGPQDTKPCSVTKDHRTGRIVRGVPIDHTDNRHAPTGVSVVFVTYEPHNKRQDMN